MNCFFRFAKARASVGFLAVALAVGATALSSPVQARSTALSGQSALDALISLYSEIGTALEDYEHLNLDISLPGWEGFERIFRSAQCQNLGAFKKLTPKQLRARLQSDLDEAAERIALLGQSGLSAQLPAQINDVLNRLELELRGREIQVCHAYTSPAYTDGVSSNVVMVDGVIEFAFDLGRPD